MGRGSGRGPKPLRFRSLLECLGAAAERVTDARRQASVDYRLSDCYRSAYAMFFLQDPSVLAFQRRFQSQLQSNNLSSVFGVEEIPSDTQFRELLDAADYRPVTEVFATFIRRLQRSKELERYRFYEGSYLLTIDGGEYFTSEQLQCEYCLTRKKSSGTHEHFHQALQPALVHPELREVLPLAPEFIRRQDGASKQDCETNAAARLTERLRSEYPQLPLTVVADSLHATSPSIRRLKDKRCSFLLAVKPGSHKHLFEEIAGLRSGEMLGRRERRDRKGRRYLYEWANELAFGADPKSPQVNFLALTIFNTAGKRTFRGSWVSDMPIDEQNVEQLVRGARARWKIENEGFNTLKNQGYHLKHNFGHGNRHLSEAFFVVNLLAFFAHQISQLVDRAYQQARAGFSSRVEFWNVIRAMFRLFLFTSWDEVLQRMNSPPQPL